MAWGWKTSRYESRYPEYVSAAEKKNRAEKQAQKLSKEGEKLEPLNLQGTRIAATFWGKSWCGNLEKYSDYSNRLPRGRSYVRSGAVIDLKIEKCKIKALVSGTRVYKVEIGIKALPKNKWDTIKSACSGQIATLIDLLRGKFSQAIMEKLCVKGEGLFPEPSEIDLDCTCPDWADMCKHVAAVLYGVGAKLDEKPELLFLLRDVDKLDLISHAASGGDLAVKTTAKDAGIADSEIGDVFGIELEASPKNSHKKEKKTAKTASAKKKKIKKPVKKEAKGKGRSVRSASNRAKISKLARG